MHCIVKKTLEIIIRSGNDYLVKVKGNQPNLLKYSKQLCEKENCISQNQTLEKTRGRYEKRLVKIFSPKGELPKTWPDLNRVIYVERYFKQKEKIHHSQSYYISSLDSDDAKLFANGIRGHWYIENKLHWVKDVILKEDISKLKSGVASQNMSVLRNISINIFRQNQYSSTKHATLFFASNVKELYKIISRT